MSKRREQFITTKIITIQMETIRNKKPVQNQIIIITINVLLYILIEMID